MLAPHSPAVQKALTSPEPSPRRENGVTSVSSDPTRPLESHDARRSCDPATSRSLSASSRGCAPALSAAYPASDATPCSGSYLSGRAFASVQILPTRCSAMLCSRSGAPATSKASTTASCSLDSVGTSVRVGPRTRRRPSTPARGKRRELGIPNQTTPLDQDPEM